MKELIVPNKFNNKKLQVFLAYTFPNLSNSLFYKTLRKKDIKVNDVRISENVLLTAGDNVKVYIVDELLSPTPQVKINIIYEDNNILVANKPAQIEVVSNASNSNKNNCKCNSTTIANSIKEESTLTNILKKQLEINYLEPCHRLDRNTTGLVLFAKNEKALNILLDKFKNHEIEKHYLANVYGIPRKHQETLHAYLFKDNKKSQVYISDTPKKGYVPIDTKYKILSVDKEKNCSVLDVELLTGKTHQIRAHLAHVGYPIIGDGKYGKNEVNKKFGFKTQQLCSYSIAFRFKTESGILSYLNNKVIVLPNV
jgi:23S rRNA pseudouridine955/2504/2580 synthase